MTRWGVLVVWLAACEPGQSQPPATASDGLALAVARGEFPRTTSALLEHAGEPVYERYFDGADAKTLHDPRSVGKSITALAVGVAVTEGKVASVNDSAFEHLADLAPFAHDGPVKAAITIADLLTMSSALACDDEAEQSPGNERNMYPERRWARWALG